MSEGGLLCAEHVLRGCDFDHLGMFTASCLADADAGFMTTGALLVLRR